MGSSDGAGRGERPSCRLLRSSSPSRHTIQAESLRCDHGLPSHISNMVPSTVHVGPPEAGQTTPQAIAVLRITGPPAKSQ